MTLIKDNSIFKQYTGPLTNKVRLENADQTLGKVPSKNLPDHTTNMICGYCSTGCSLKVHIKDGNPVNVTTDKEYPANKGMACPKGWESLAVMEAPDRATVPLLRNADGKLEEVSWENAMEEFVSRFKQIQKDNGEDSVAFLSTGQIVSEEMAYLGALAKFGMGFKHGDGNTRQCMATAVTSYKQSFGFDSPPFAYSDLEESDLLIFVGANPAIAHPIIWKRVINNKRNPHILVVDPRKTETANAATEHLALQPKTDQIFFYSLAQVLIKNDWIDHDFIKAHTNGFSEFSEFLNDYSPEAVAVQCGVSPQYIYDLAKKIHETERVSFWWTMGVNQGHQSTRTAQSLINLALITGNIGKVGTGANSITGQCNAMGSRLFSNTSSLICGHEFTKKEDREKIASILEIDESLIPTENSWDYNRILEGVEKGEIKALWVIATNPAHSWIHQKKAKAILDKLEFLVVQDIYHTTDTCKHADLILPAAGWGEKDGTFINSERRIGLVKKVKKAPGKALADFHIFRLIAHYWGCEELFKKWSTAESVFQILKELSKDQPCDITAIKDYKMIDECGGIQWPLKDEKSLATERRLFADGKFFTADQKARILFQAPKALPEKTSEDFPFILMTGRGSSAQWHTQTRTSKSSILRRLYPSKCYVEINPKDARRLGIEPNTQIRVASKRSEIEVTAFVTPTIKSGQIYAPMHYLETNKLTFPAFDEFSKQPAYKYCAVNLEVI